jgi:alkanesulfonate monooxygenase SsuD/methylene tetrahydromethanopterin reductase-like flavin-dependent oxidoreductase (luciferase family)
VDGCLLRVLRADDVAGLRAEAIRAEQDGIEAILVGEGPLGDPFVLAAFLSETVASMLLGVRVVLGAGGRHPALLAREATSLELVCGGQTVLCFAPPFGEGLEEAIILCREMWRDGTATSEGPVYPVAGAVNRPRPAGGSSPLLALDLTGSGARDEAGGAAALADMVVVTAADGGDEGDEGGEGDGGGEDGDGRGSVWRLERVRA